MLKRLKLSKEALLFDSPLYLLKAFLSVMLAYVLFSQHHIVGKDMISVLFGMMLSLEPVSVSGLKSGIAQFQATILGGLVTAVIVAGLGVNMITVPLAVMLTLYISILLDWKNISPVAFFTSIYMTQYIQLTASGDPSMLLTLRLRLLALGSGVLVAILMNYIFGVLYYKSMVHKRTKYLIEKITCNYNAYVSAVKTGDIPSLHQLRDTVTLLFGDIDLVYSHVSDLNSEKRTSSTLEAYLSLLGEIRLMNHYNLDMIIEILDDDDEKNVLTDAYLSDIETIQTTLNALVPLESSIDMNAVKYKTEDKNIIKIKKRLIKMNESLERIMDSKK